MAGDLTVLDGNTFFVSDPAGDVEPGPDPNGFFHADMRHLSSWRLLINGQSLYVLTSRAVDYYSAAIFGTLATAGVGENPPISIRRGRSHSGPGQVPHPPPGRRRRRCSRRGPSGRPPST